MMKKLIYFIISLMLTVDFAFSQDNLNQTHIPDKYRMFSREITRRMDLNIKQNRPFYSKNTELPTILLEALHAGDLNAYRSDSCEVVIADSVLQNMLNLVETQQVPEDPNDPFSPMVQKKVVTTIPPEIFEIVYIKERAIFDRNRSRLYWQIYSLSMTVPGNPEYLSAYGIAGELDKVIHFKYDEVVDLFRSTRYLHEALWFNNQNIASHRNMADAFELRLFYAPIIKVQNNQNLDIRQMYGDIIAKDPMQAIFIQQKLENELMELEASFWTY